MLFRVRNIGSEQEKSFGYQFSFWSRNDSFDFLLSSQTLIPNDNEQEIRCLLKSALGIELDRGGKAAKKVFALVLGVCTTSREILYWNINV